MHRPWTNVSIQALRYKISCEHIGSSTFLPCGYDIETYRFTCLLAWIHLLPFPSGGVIKLHLQAWDSKKAETVTALRNSLYLDDYLIGGQAEELKNSDIDIFSDAKFVLCTCTSNVSESEDNHDVKEKNNDLSIAKQQLGSRQSESKVLRLPRDKDTDPRLSEERDRNDQGRSAEEPDQSVWWP